MQLTPEILEKFAENTVQELISLDNDVVAIYMCGSLVMGGNPLLGGTTDIDLVVIHSGEPRLAREILRLTDEAHLDIRHHRQADYRQGRELRIDPILGPTVFNAKVMYDPRHFMDYTQAAVRGQFHRADNVLKRSHSLFDQARQIWMGFNLSPVEPELQAILTYLNSVSLAANALVILIGEPLTERRFLLDFRTHVGNLGKPGLHAGLLGLLGGSKVNVATLNSWLPLWESAFQSVTNSDHPIELHNYRFTYYKTAFEAILGSGQPHDLLWPLLYTWTLAASVLPTDTLAVEVWRDAAGQLGLLGDGFSERVAALDAYLDLVSETISEWGNKQGV